MKKKIKAIRHKIDLIYLLFLAVKIVDFTNAGKWKVFQKTKDIL